MSCSRLVADTGVRSGVTGPACGCSSDTSRPAVGSPSPSGAGGDGAAAGAAAVAAVAAEAGSAGTRHALTSRSNGRGASSPREGSSQGVSLGARPAEAPGSLGRTTSPAMATCSGAAPPSSANAPSERTSASASPASSRRSCRRRAGRWSCTPGASGSCGRVPRRSSSRTGAATAAAAAAAAVAASPSPPGDAAASPALRSSMVRTRRPATPMITSPATLPHATCAHSAGTATRDVSITCMPRAAASSWMSRPSAPLGLRDSARA